MSGLNLRGLRRHLPIVIVIAVLILAVPAGGALFIYSGVYNIAGDVPHTKLVFNLVDKFRDESVDAHAKGLTAPADLTSPTRISTGAGLYGELCTGCHLAPGMKKTDLSRGLYPKPPQLAYGTDLSPEQEFWIIKHGLKLTGMPSWGRTHSDDEVWDIVAFLKKMPELDPDAYKAAVSAAAATASPAGPATKN